ncbi:MAG: YqhA family protein, partial [Hyphomicrobiales bacterium]
MKLLAMFEGCLLLVRWLQLPLLIGLVVALVVFELKFVAHLISIVSDMDTLTRERAILVTLDLIDMVLIANLVVMVVISGYETFISRLHMDDEPSVPASMRHSTTGKLKLRIATTILLISTIHLLHAYLDP